VRLVAVVAGVDLGGTKIQVAIVRNRRVMAEPRVATPQVGKGEQVVAAIVDAIDEGLKSADATRDDLGGVGIGSPGVISEDGTVRGAANVPGFESKFALGPELSKALDGVSVSVDNDVRVASVGEHKRGAGRPFRDLLVVAVGTGVGGGLILGNRLRRGRGAAGEIGHTVVKDGGRQCGCGRFGCLEAYAGRRSIEAAARRRLERGEKTTLFEIMKHKGRDRVTSGVIAKALEEGDRVTTHLVDEAVWALGVALGSAQNLLDLEAIVLAGGLADRLGDPFTARVREAIAPHVFATYEPQVVSSELGDLSGAVGAAILAGG
jgi:glucokinase